MAVRSLVKNLTNEDLFDMSAGGRRDVSDDATWFIRALVQKKGEPGQTEFKAEFGTRTHIEAQQAAYHAAAVMLVELGVIEPGPNGKGVYTITALPAGWLPGDGWAYPFIEEIVEERANRGI